MYVAIGLSIFAMGLFTLRQYLKGGVFKSRARIDGKVVVITGANSGIGKETATDLAKRGGKIIMACRDPKRAELAAREIRRTAGVREEMVIVEPLDLSSFKSVRAFADRLKTKERRIDILINNAGVMWTPYTKTEDGNELQFQVNHLGHFLLTNLLLDRLKASPEARVVTVASIAHSHGAIKVDDLNSETSYGRDEAYAQSKLANILFTEALANKLKNTSVTTYCLHPGIVATELARSVPYIDYKLVYTLVRIFVMPFFKSPQQGAQTSLYCAVEPLIADESGKYYSECIEKTPASHALDDVMAEKLWAASETLVGLI